MSENVTENKFCIQNNLCILVYTLQGWRKQGAREVEGATPLPPRFCRNRKEDRKRQVITVDPTRFLYIPPHVINMRRRNWLEIFLKEHSKLFLRDKYSHLPNKRAGRNKSAGCFFLQNPINRQGSKSKSTSTQRKINIVQAFLDSRGFDFCNF